MRSLLGILAFGFVFSAQAQTLEERVHRLEHRVRKLEAGNFQAVPKTIYYQKGTSFFSVNGDCSKINRMGSWSFQTTLKYVKEIKCDNVTYVVASFTIPAGYDRTGEFSIQAYDKNDLIIEE